MIKSHPRNSALLVPIVALWLSLSAAAGERSALSSALESITIGELKSHVDILADDTFEGREAGSRGGRAAGHYLMEQLHDLGLQAAGVDGHYDQPFGRGYRNLLVMIEGRDPDLKKEFVLVGAHYDHVGYGTARNSYGPLGFIHNGADDNASGTAALLEIADACRHLPMAPRRSILFALWDGEEKGLLGSKHWLAQPTVPLASVVLAINLDMVGRLSDRGIEVFGTRTSPGLRQLVSRQNERTNLRLSFPWQTVDDSDHYSFFSRGIPYLMLHTGVHADYHRPSDDADKINAEGMHAITQLVMNLLFQLAEGPKPGGFRAKARQESEFAKREFERPLPALPPRLGVRWQREADRGRPGLLLTSITSESPADRAGLRVGDRLVRFDDREVTDEDGFRRDVLQAESPVPVVLERPDVNEPIELTVALDGAPVKLGIAWRENDAEPGVIYLVRVDAGLPAYDAGLRPGDRIYELAGRTFATSDEFLQRVTTLPLPLEMRVECHGQLRRVVLQ